MTDTVQLPAVRPPTIVDALIPKVRNQTLAPTSDFYYDSIGAQAAGQHVTSDTALTYSGYWAGLNFIAGLFGRLPAKVFQDTADGRRERKNHHVYRVIAREPNEDMDSFIFWEMMAKWYVNAGYAIAERQVLGDSGQLHALWPIHPSRSRPERVGGRKTGRWLVRMNDGGEVPLERSEVFRLTGNLSDDGEVGKGLIVYAARAIGVGLAQQNYEAGFYGNGGRPSGVLMHKGTLSDKARDAMRREWRTIHAEGNEIAILWEGTDYRQISVDPEHAKLMQSKIGTLGDMSRFLDLPPHVLYELSRGTFNNTGEMNRFLVSHPLNARLVRVEKAMNKQLFTQAEKKAGYYTKFMVNALLRGTPKERAEYNQVLLRNGVLSQDEWRAQEELNKLPDGLGETFWMRRDMAPLELVKEAAKREIEKSTVIPDTPEGPPTPPTPDESNEDAQNRTREYRGHIRRLTADLRGFRQQYRDETARLSDVAQKRLEQRDAARGDLARSNEQVEAADSKLQLALERERDAKQAFDAALADKLVNDEQIAGLIRKVSGLEKAKAELEDQAKQDAHQLGIVNERAKEAESARDAALGESNAKDSTISALQEQMTALGGDVRRLTTELTAANDKTSKLEAVCAELTEAKLDVERAAKESGERADDATARLKGATESLAELQSKHGETLESLNRSKREVQTVEKQRDTAAGKLEAAETALSGAQNTLAATEREKVKAESALSDVQQRIDRLDRESQSAISKATKRGDDFKSQVDSLSSDLGAMRAERSTLQQQNTVLAKSRDELASSLTDAQKEAEAAAERAVAAENEAKVAENVGQQRLKQVRAVVSDSTRSLLGESLQFLLSQEQHEVKTAARKADRFKQIVGNYYHHFQSRLVGQLRAASDAIEQLGGERVDVAKLAADYVAESRTKLHNVFHTTKRDDLRVAVNQELKSWEGRRQQLLDWIGGDG